MLQISLTIRLSSISLLMNWMAMRLQISRNTEMEVRAEMEIGDPALTPVDPLGKLSTTWATLKSQR